MPSAGCALRLRRPTSCGSILASRVSIGKNEDDGALAQGLVELLRGCVHVLGMASRQG